jgi:hypothetical protein
MSGERPHYTVGLESLRDQIAVQLLELSVVGNAGVRTKTSGKSGFDQDLIVDAAEDLVDGASRGRRGDAGVFDLPPHAQPPASLDGRLGSRDGFRDTRVVDGALVLQAPDGRVDGFGLVATTGETLTDLRFGKLAPGKHLQAIEVSGSDHGLSGSRFQT